MTVNAAKLDEGEQCCVHTTLILVTIIIIIIIIIIGASVSEPLSSDLNVNFVCLSVCLSVMDRQLTVNHFRFLFCAFCVMR